MAVDLTRVQVRVYGPLRSATGEKTVEVAVDGSTVGDVVEAFAAAYPRTASQLRDDEGAVRPSVRVMVDGDRASLDDSLPADATVQLFPAMRGG